MTTRLTLLFLLFLSFTRSALAAPSAPLFEIYVQRFVIDASGQPILDFGRFSAKGEYTHYNAVQLGRDFQIPAAALNQNLLPLDIFVSYNALGPQTLANFKIQSSVRLNGQELFVMAVGDKPKLDIGAVLNLSARGTVSPGGDPLVGGFVVSEHPRRVLLRAVGPTLISFGVSSALADPVITLFRQGEAAGFATNDDWAQQANAGEIEAAAASVGAFALPRASKDAVLLVELPPGAYTAHASTRTSIGGTALLEVYMLP